VSIQDATGAPVVIIDAQQVGSLSVEREVVSTHVLVSEEQVDRLRELSRRTRIAQSEYLREAVDDLLGKYGKLPSEER
jgi:hypothetical protein